MSRRQLIQKMLQKNIALRRKRPVGALMSGERGETITTEICFSAAGVYKQPMFIFPRKRMQQALLNEIVPGRSVGVNDRGWIEMKLFFVWFKKFVEASEDSSVLLLLDGHHNGVVLLFPSQVHTLLSSTGCCIHETLK